MNRPGDDPPQLGAAGEGTAPPLDPSPETFQAWVREAAAYVARHLGDLSRAHAAGGASAGAARVLADPRAEIGEAPVEGGLADLWPVLDRAFAAGLLTTGPGYLAYVPGGGLPVAAVADLVADVMNRYTGLAEAAPGPCALEERVLRFLCREFGWGEGSGGVLLPGGSVANFTAVVAARCAVLPPDADLRKARVYVSSQVHHSVTKSVHMAGIPVANVVSIPTDDRFRMDPGALARRVEADRAADRLPFLVVTQAGTTNTGAVDPFLEVSAVARRHGLWHHVDGAYGGAFQLCPEGRARLSGVETADSIAIDPHKGLFLPYGTGCLLARDVRALERAFSMDAPYLQDFVSPAPVPSPCARGPEFSRPFRGLRLWLAFRLHGVAAFRRALAEKLALARRLHEGIDRLAAEGVPIACVDPPQLSVVAFRLRRRRGEARGEANARNRAFLDAIARPGRVFLSSTLLPAEGGPALTLRACVLSFRTDRARIDAALEDIAAAARKLA